ncbi:Protein adenylyltransferase FICD [Dissostichus eleginoides]|uniref:Protein adenylyltransferase FICD n=1 Tax=Dissostichus eleginoides TaxID=100907 RepID=A0AAD9F497_DISEL|nr:Protein adenylyltransferase FICD [Dissostichus eleginoides]
MAVLIVEGRAHQLLSSNGKVEVHELPTIYSNQEETDTGWHSTFILLLPLESLGEDCCATLLGFHVFSGEDCPSAFKGKGKVGPLKKLVKNPKFHRAFSQLGDNWNVKPEVLKQLEQFTCLIYGESRESSVDAVRAKLLRKMVGSKVDLARLPPCYDALKPHVQRLNHPCTSELMNPF